VGGGGEDESVDVVLLVVLYLLVSAEERTGAFYLLDEYDVRFPQQASAVGETGESALRN